MEDCLPWHSHGSFMRTVNSGIISIIEIALVGFFSVSFDPTAKLQPSFLLWLL
jgi:hypothetical protein